MKNAVTEAPRTWKVTRWCCTSGQCVECYKTSHGRARRRIVHADNLTEEKAREMEKNWRNYDAKAVHMWEDGGVR